MDMIDEELTRLRNRIADLKNREISNLENRTQYLYQQIMQLPKDSDQRPGLESEYKSLSIDLRNRSDEVIKLNQQIENLELEKTLRR